MTFKYNGIDHTFPAQLSEITLGKRIAFYEVHGKLLDEMATKMQAIADPFDKEAASNLLHLEIAMRSFSFYTGIPLEEITKHVNIASLLSIYNAVIQPLYEQEKNITPQQQYQFNGETWVIGAPELLATSDMRLNEFLHAKEITRQLHQLGMGNWTALPYLCAIYLRKEGEEFSESFTPEGSERMQLMQELPLDIALGVGFFLSNTLNIYITTSHSFIKPTQRESIPAVTLSVGDG